jgi:hypothetical protein
MIIKISIISIIMLAFCFTPFSMVMALHDDEAIGKGGAWNSDDIKTDQSVSSSNEESIDSELDKTFKKSPIVIPALTKESDEQDSDDQKSDDQDSVNPENKDMDNSGSSAQ